MPVKAPPARSSAVPQESIDLARTIPLATTRGKTSAEGVFAEIDVALKNHRDSFGPSLKKSFNQKLQTILPSLGIKSTNEEEFLKITNEIAEETVTSSFEKLGTIQDASQINEVVASSLTENIIAHPLLAAQLKKDEQAIYSQAEQQTKVVVDENQKDLEKSATLETISRVAKTSETDIREITIDGVQDAVEEDSPLATPHDQAVLITALNSYQKEYLATLAKGISPDQLPTFEELKEIQTSAHVAAVEKIAAQTPEVAKINIRKLIQNYAINPNLHFVPMPAEKIESYGLGYAQPNWNSFTKGAHFTIAPTTIKLATNQKFQQQAYSALLYLNKDRLDSNLNPLFKRAEELSKKRTLSYKERKEFLTIQKEIRPYLEAQNLALKEPKQFKNILKNLPESVKKEGPRTAHKVTRALSAKKSFINQFKQGKDGRLYIANRVWGSLAFAQNIYTLHFSPTAIFHYINFKQVFYQAALTDSNVSPFNNTPPVGQQSVTSKANPAQFTKNLVRTKQTLASRWNVFIIHFSPTAIFHYINFKQVFYPSEGAGAFSTFRNAINTKRAASGLSKGISIRRSVSGAVKAGSMVAKGTNPLGWAMLAAQLANSKFLKKVRNGAAALGAVFLLNAGLHLLGAIVGAIFGAVTGLPLLLIPGAGPFLYAGWVMGWTGYGFINPYGMFTIASKALQLPVQAYNSIKGFFSSAGEGTGGIASSIGSFGSSFLGGTANAASAVWGGALNIGGGFLGGLSSGASFVTGALSSTVSFSTATVATVVSTTVGGIATLAVIGGIATASSFISLEAEQANDVPGDNEFLTITKVADETQMPNPPPNQNRTFTIKLVAKTKLTNISITDKMETRSAGGSSEITTDKDGTTFANLTCNTGTLEVDQDCTATIVITVTETYSDSIIINTAKVTATPEGQEPTNEVAIATVRVGNPPTKCTQGWPTKGSITQGPEGSTSHGPLVLEALDIGAPVGENIYATVDGVVIPNDRANTALDKTIDVRVTSCPTLDIVRFQHLSFVNIRVGEEVTFGQIVGKGGSNCRGQNDPDGCGPHLHYQFNVGNRNYRMEPPNIPQSVNRTCSGDCNVTITNAP